MKVVDTQNALDLSEESSQESEVPTGHPDETCYDLRDELFFWKRDAGRRPSLFEQLLHLSIVEGPKFMNKPDAGVELRKARHAFFDTRHADQDHASGTLVKDGSHLFEAVHLESIGLV